MSEQQVLPELQPCSYESMKDWLHNKVRILTVPEGEIDG